MTTDSASDKTRQAHH